MRRTQLSHAKNITVTSREHNCICIMNPMVSETTQMVAGTTTDMLVTMVRLYTDQHTGQVWQHGQGNKIATNITIIKTKELGTNIEQYHTHSSRFSFQNNLRLLRISRRICSHPIVTAIFTNILRAGTFSPICLIISIQRSSEQV